MDDLQALVNVDCGTSNKAGVEAVGRIFRSLLRADGFELTEFPLAELNRGRTKAEGRQLRHELKNKANFRP
jgi:hypothetical protein